MTSRKKGRGRASKYETQVAPHLERIEKWARAGATDAEICEALGIARSTFCDYKAKYTELSDALSRAKKAVTIEIRAALLKRALGGVYTDTRKIKFADGSEKTETVLKEVPPDANACAMLLRNYTEDWRDKDAHQNETREREVQLKEKMAQQNYFFDI